MGERNPFRRGRGKQLRDFAYFLRPIYGVLLMVNSILKLYTPQNQKPQSPHLNSPEFWAFFDSLPKDAQDRLNYARNGPDWEREYALVCQQYYKQEDWL